MVDILGLRIMTDSDVTQRESEFDYDEEGRHFQRRAVWKRKRKGRHIRVVLRATAPHDFSSNAQRFWVAKSTKRRNNRTVVKLGPNRGILG